MGEGNLKKKVLLGVAIVAGWGTLEFGSFYLWYKSDCLEAQAYNNYRLEELQKVQQKLKDGEIDKSEFDVKVSYINGLEDETIFQQFWEDENHKGCCQELYKKGAGLGIASIACGLGALVPLSIATVKVKDALEL